MSAANNNDLFYVSNEDMLGENNTSSDGVISIALNQEDNNKKSKEQVIDIDRFSLNQNSKIQGTNNSDNLNITVKLGESENQDANIDATLAEPTFKKRNKFLSFFFGPSKAEREYIKIQEAKQRKELRKRARLIASQNKEQKIRVINENILDDSIINDSVVSKIFTESGSVASDSLSSGLSSGEVTVNNTTSNTINDTVNFSEATNSNSVNSNLESQDIFDDNIIGGTKNAKSNGDLNLGSSTLASSITKDIISDIEKDIDKGVNNSINKDINKSASSDIVRTYKPLNFSSYDENIKQLELKISHFNVVLGRNILPDRFKRKKRYTQSEPKEELSEIDKLYLAAFSDVTIPEEDVDLDEDSVFIDDPVEMEDLFDLADESLTNSMESAIFSQISGLKRDILEDSILEQEIAKNREAKKLENQKTQKPFGGLQRGGASKVNLTSDFCPEDIARSDIKSALKNNTKNDIRNNDVKKRSTTRVVNKDFAKNDAKQECDANFIVRYSAFFIDIAFLSVVCLATSIFIMSYHFDDVSSILTNQLYLIEFLLIFVKTLILITLAYYMISYTILQTSLGLKLLSYKLKSEDGRRPKIRQILVRVLCMPINFILSFGLLGKNSIHDKLSKTKLVKC